MMKLVSGEGATSVFCDAAALLPHSVDRQRQDQPLQFCRHRIDPQSKRQRVRRLEQRENGDVGRPSHNTDARRANSAVHCTRRTVRDTHVRHDSTGYLSRASLRSGCTIHT